jgi:hypothetical protein
MESGLQTQTSRGLWFERSGNILQGLGSWIDFRLISETRIWQEVILGDFVRPHTLLEWIRSPQRIYDGASLFWRSIVKVLPLITQHLIWGHWEPSADNWRSLDRFRCRLYYQLRSENTFDGLQSYISINPGFSESLGLWAYNLEAISKCGDTAKYPSRLDKTPQ